MYFMKKEINLIFEGEEFSAGLSVLLSSVFEKLTFLILPLGIVSLSSHYSGCGEYCLLSEYDVGKNLNVNCIIVSPTITSLCDCMIH